ncbi:hypothetical protein VIGAN_UM024400, partial [Vigna angularis var. angularis]
MSTYFDFVNTACFASASDYDSPSACYYDCNSYSADFYVENNMTHPLISESALCEPVSLKEDDLHCDLTPGLIHLLPKFHGFAGECPHRHLEELHIMCSSMKPPDVPLDYIFLSAFPHSLQGAAKDWKDSLPLRSVTDWGYLEHQFLSKFSLVQYVYSNGLGW